MIIYILTITWKCKRIRNLVERITILSSNESKQKINQVIDDILNPSSKIQNSQNILEQSFQSPLKEAREHFEKEYLSKQLKNIMAISPRQQILLEWKDLHYKKIKIFRHQRNKLKNEYNHMGAGKVGFSISKQLSAQGHSVTVIDQSSDDIKKINDTQDGKNSWKSIIAISLESAGAEKADMIIAVTRNDETNMIVCQ